MMAIKCGLILFSQGVPTTFHWRAEAEEPKADSGGGALGQGAATPSPPPRGLGSAVSSPAEFAAEP